MMLSDVITIKAALIGSFDEPQALLIQFIGRHSIAIDPIEDAKFYRRARHHRKYHRTTGDLCSIRVIAPNVKLVRLRRLRPDRLCNIFARHVPA